MAFSDLFESRPPAFYRSHRVTQRRPVFFVHIPKTAGSSFGREMRRRFRPNANILFDYHPGAPSHVEQSPRLVNAHLARKDRGDLLFVSSHIPFRYLCPYSVVEPGIQFVTILRHPLRRFVSDYRYQRTPEHPQHARFREQYPTFAHYLDARGVNNRMTAHLRAYPDEPLPDLIARLERDFLFIGTQEDYALSFRVIMALAGREADPTVVTNRAQDRDSSAVVTSEDEVARFEERNQSDFTLFTHFQTRLERGREQLENLLRDLREDRSAKPSLMLPARKAKP